MAQEKPSRIAEWIHAARAHAPVLRQRFGAWAAIVREDPNLIWQTPAVRYTTYATGAVVITWLVSIAIGLLTPAPPANARPTASSADFFCLCTDPGCGHRFVINREFGFDDFPAQCPKCRQKKGLQARPCQSTRCSGRWVVPQVRDDARYCPVCGERFN